MIVFYGTVDFSPLSYKTKSIILMKRIALDMDDVIANVVPKLLDLYEAEFG
ncbi:MAG: hypothetical protein ACI9JY_000983, partial [Saprospiraceae bacterium]